MLGAGSRTRGLLLAAVTIAVAVWLFYTVQDLGGPRAMRHALGPTAPLWIVAVLALVSVAPLPTELLAIPAAGIYGFWLGTAMVWTAWVTSSYIQFVLVRRAVRAWVPAPSREGLPGVLARLPADHPAFLICGRWLPWGPHVVNAAAGFVGVGRTRYLCCAAIGVLPQAAAMSAIGNALLG